MLIKPGHDGGVLFLQWWLYNSQTYIIHTSSQLQGHRGSTLLTPDPSVPVAAEEAVPSEKKLQFLAWTSQETILEKRNNGEKAGFGFIFLLLADSYACVHVPDA